MQKIKYLWSKLWFRILSVTLAVLFVIIFALGITVGCLWGDVISSVSSIKLLQTRNDDNNEGSVYRMDVKGGFFFDKFLEHGGASNDTELIKFITSNITKGLIDVNIGESDVNCSAFMAKTPENDVLFARNYDFKKTNVCMTICNNPGKGRYKSFSTVDLNYVGIAPDEEVESIMDRITCFAAPFAPLDGMNEVGLSCGIFMSYQGNDLSLNDSGTVATDQKDENKKNITSTTMQRMILDYCATVDEAVEMIEGFNLHDSAKSSFHYMIADATGKSAILEWLPENGTDLTDNDGSARTLKVIYNTDERYDELRNGDGFKYQWITNFIVNDHDSYYENDDAKPGRDRYEHIYKRLHESDGVLADENAAMDILAEVGRRTWKPNGTAVTVHSVVYNLTDKTVLWVANENFDDKTATYSYSFETGKLTALA